MPFAQTTPHPRASPSRVPTLLACDFVFRMLQACSTRAFAGGPTDDDVHHHHESLLAIHLEHKRNLDGTRTFVGQSTERIRVAREVRTLRCRGSCWHGLPGRSGLAAETFLCGVRPLVASSSRRNSRTFHSVSPVRSVSRRGPSPGPSEPDRSFSPFQAFPIEPEFDSFSTRRKPGLVG